VTTLQKFAVISSMQNTPVIGACLGADALAALFPACDGGSPFSVVTCAAAGDAAAMTNAAMNGSLDIGATGSR
jgi:hypothetical protein